MKRSNLFFMIVLVFLLAVCHSVSAYSNELSLNKSTFRSADDFYKNNVDKKDYQELINAKLNVRKLMMVKDLPKIFDEKEWKNEPSAWKRHLKKGMIGNTRNLNPEKPVYYFFSLKDDGEKIHIKYAMYDAMSGKIRSKGGGHWTKKEFKRKFEKI